MNRSPLFFLIAVFVSVVPSLAAVATNRWIRPVDGDPRVSVDSNWSLRHAPKEDEVVLFSARTARSAVWDKDAVHAVAGWVQEPGYVAVVTFETGPGSTFEKFTVNGDMDLQGGALTHPQNGDAETWWLNLCVTGALRVGEEAKISVSAKGYGPGKGPGVGLVPGSGASHGGQGAPKAQSAEINAQPVYGSVRHPRSSGSGGTAREGSPHGPYGGGVLLLEVGGLLDVKGKILANADTRDVKDSTIGGASGGSIEMHLGGEFRLAENARISANGGPAFHEGGGGGGGGRIAFYTARQTPLESLPFHGQMMERITVNGGTGDTRFRNDVSKDRHIRGANGTVYVESVTADSVPGGGRCSIYGWARPSLAGTRLPIDGGNLMELQDAEVVVGRGGFLVLGGPLQLRALGFHETGGADLNLATLTAGQVRNAWREDRPPFTIPGMYRDNTASDHLGPVFFNGGVINILPYFKPIVSATP